jgi:hypothetical protein
VGRTRGRTGADCSLHDASRARRGRGRRDCGQNYKGGLRLVKHRPDPGVTYQPGVDVDGNPVADADLYDRPRLDLPERLDIPIEVDLPDQYGLPVDNSFKGDVQVGTVTVDVETGRATFNGQPLTSAAEEALRIRCQTILQNGPSEGR